MVLLKKSREGFLEEMVRARHLGVEKLIFHPGSHMGSGEQVGLRRIAESLDWTRKEFGGSEVHQVLEITAGAGNLLGSSFEQITKIIDLMEDQKSVGVCLDTCHSYASGYDIKTKKGYEQTMDAFDDLLGIGYLEAIHLNDSKAMLGSNRDRHEQIGKGYLGLDAFRNLLNDDRLGDIPMILETPAGDKMYKKELKILRSLIKE
jgi:apurinic endonuclease APN1